MAKRIMFVAVFVPVHFFLTLLLLQYYWIDYDARVADLSARLCHILAAIFAVPLFLLFSATGLSEYSPLWLQLLTLVFYSLLWALLVLAVRAIIRRSFASKPVPQGFQPAHPSPAADTVGK